jgi:hypothetical protein
LVEGKKLILVSIAIGTAIAALIALFVFGFGGLQQKIQRTLPPRVEITSKNARWGYVGLDYTMWIDVSVHNFGGAGTVVVWAEVVQGSNVWTKSQSVYLDAKESKELTFEFREVSFWSSSDCYYSVWVTY